MDALGGGGCGDLAGAGRRVLHGALEQTRGQRSRDAGFIVLRARVRAGNAGALALALLRTRLKMHRPLATVFGRLRKEVGAVAGRSFSWEDDVSARGDSARFTPALSNSELRAARKEMGGEGEGGRGGEGEGGQQLHAQGCTAGEQDSHAMVSPAREGLVVLRYCFGARMQRDYILCAAVLFGLYSCHHARARIEHAAHVENCVLCKPAHTRHALLRNVAGGSGLSELHAQFERARGGAGAAGSDEDAELGHEQSQAVPWGA